MEYDPRHGVLAARRYPHHLRLPRAADGASLHRAQPAQQAVSRRSRVTARELPPFRELLRRSRHPPEQVLAHFPALRRAVIGAVELSQMVAGKVPQRVPGLHIGAPVRPPGYMREALGRCLRLSVRSVAAAPASRRTFSRKTALRRVGKRQASTEKGIPRRYSRSAGAVARSRAVGPCWSMTGGS